MKINTDDRFYFLVFGLVICPSRSPDVPRRRTFQVALATLLTTQTQFYLRIVFFDCIYVCSVCFHHHHRVLLG